MVWHLLLPLSKGWGAGTDSRFDVKTLKQHIEIINAEGGTVTFDLPIAADGKIPAGVLRTLGDVAKDHATLTNGRRDP